jgi:TPR repeat protein
MKALSALFCSLLIAVGVSAAEGEGMAFGDVERQARGGDVEAQLEVGILYEFGFGMKNNLVPALAWYLLAADQGNPQAIERRDFLLKQLGKDQIAEARKLSQTLLVAMPKKKESMEKAPKTETGAMPDKSSMKGGAMPEEVRP